VLDGFFSGSDLAAGALNYLLHYLPPVEDAPGALVLVYEQLDLLQKFLVHQFILRNQRKHVVYLNV
jgi:hypothetical protein